MSKPVTNSQVEDVLSSIRRLVSDNRKNGRSPDSNVAPDKLVLTPQLRVPQDESSETQDDAEEYVGEEADEALDLFEEPAEPEDGDFVFRRHTDAEVTGQDAPEDEDPQRPSDLTSKIAALETAIARTADQWEPDGNGRDAYAGTPAPHISWQDNIELDATGTPLSQDTSIEAVATVGAGAEEAASLSDLAGSRDDEADQVIDEEALRELVAEIVRSELQGELGERITRNVRKLVRREIMRALASRELD